MEKKAQREIGQRLAREINRILGRPEGLVLRLAGEEPTVQPTYRSMAEARREQSKADHDEICGG